MSRMRPKFFKGLRDRTDDNFGERVRPLHKSSRLRGAPAPLHNLDKRVGENDSPAGFGTDTIISLVVVVVVLMFVIHVLLGWAETVGISFAIMSLVLVSFEGTQKDIDFYGFFKFPPSGAYFASLTFGGLMWWIFAEYIGRWLACAFQAAALYGSFRLLRHLRSEDYRQSSKPSRLVS